MRNGKITAVVFDFDGTILDTETPAFEAWSEAFRRHGAHLCDARPMPGVTERLAEARRMGLALGIASSSSSGWVEG